EKMRDRKSRILFVLGVVALASMVLAAPVLAADIRTKDVIVIDEDVDDDLYLFASSITVNGTVHGDLIAAGGDIILNGTIDGDLWAAGGKVYINGTVADDVRFAGSDLKLGPSGEVGDDLFAAGFGFGADPGSAIASDVFVAGYQALLGGDIAGDVKAAVAGLEVSGHVVGDVEVEVGEPDPQFEQWSMFMRMSSPYMPELIIGPGLAIKEDAQIDGELTYTSPVTAQIPEEAVGGSVVYQTPVPEEVEAPEVEVPEVPAGALTFAAIVGWFVRWIVGMVRNFVTLLIIGVLLLWLAPKWLKEAARHWKEKPVHCLGWGVAALVAFFVAVPALFMVMIILDIVVGLATLGGLVVPITAIMMVLESVLMVGFWTVAVYVTKVVFCYLVGWLILKRPAPAWVEKAMGLIPLLIGLAIFTLVRSIPVLGAFFSMLVTIFGLGALWLLAWVRIYKPKKAASA
ncbi:MAG: polymer-forming cytoskeletal protein, partial [Anaerolineae bacterium]